MLGMNVRLQKQRIGRMGATCAISLLTCTLLLAACSTGTTTGSNGSNGGGSTNSTPTATAQPKPTTVTVTMAFCQSALSITQANQILNPPNPVINIVVDSNASGSALGSCNYAYAPERFDVFLYFVQYQGGSLTTIATAAVTNNLPGVTVTTDQAVSGVGDQSLFLSGTGVFSQNGVTLNARDDTLYVIDGGVAFTVNNITYTSPSTGTIDSLGSVSDATLESEFEQIAQSVIAAL